MSQTKRQQSYPLRLSTSLRSQAEELALREGISLNQFINLAVAEKVSRLEHDSFLNRQRLNLLKPKIAPAQQESALRRSG